MLNFITLDEDFRIIDTTIISDNYPQSFIDELLKTQIQVEDFPQQNDPSGGFFNFRDYKYINNEYVYDPLPMPEIKPIPTLEERISAVEKQNQELKAQNEELTLALADVYGGGNV